MPRMYLSHDAIATLVQVISDFIEKYKCSISTFNCVKLALLLAEDRGMNLAVVNSDDVVHPIIRIDFGVNSSSDPRVRVCRLIAPGHDEDKLKEELQGILDGTYNRLIYDR